jgi:hypothetical protein
VKKSVAGNLGGAAAHVVDVVALECDQVAGASEVDAPVVVSIAGGRVRADAVEVVVGDGDSVRRACS